MTDTTSIISDITDTVVATDEINEKDKLFQLFETECAKHNIDSLKEKAKDLTISGLSKMKKPEIVNVIFTHIWTALQVYKANVLRTMCKHLSLKPANFLAKQEQIRCLLFHMIFEKDVSPKKVLDDIVVLENITKEKKTPSAVAIAAEVYQPVAVAVAVTEEKEPSSCKIEELEKQKLQIERMLREEKERKELEERLKKEEEERVKKEEERVRKEEEKKRKEEAKEEEKKKKKQQIPKSVRIHVWDLYIGSDINKHRCICCKKTLISITNFEVGHVIAEKDGGTLEISNLRPICSVCNHSMGTENMVDFVKKYGYLIG